LSVFCRNPLQIGAASPGAEVADFEKTWQKPILFYRSKLALAVLAGTNNPKARHQAISR
jgi:hypothetical protein